MSVMGFIIGFAIGFLIVQVAVWLYCNPRK